MSLNSKIINTSWLNLFIYDVSEENSDGQFTSTKVDQILLNGNGIVMVKKYNFQIILF